ncbi:MAG TPA: type III-B CRISPR module RAMP protein Cmr4 [Oscillatoriales cyanobacterium M59_W2019_021]|nr:MAG: type III-B CRISPR module RAMP protein Cmr4 [Cyanobacteria bacterium J055]HIK29924.1 type III-B CRISPR module RAMP protein Cmr4 [Oscillatoriales cyanobacterium M4454_W2019_049]HIK50014.1 type III-B CRISPR module RAMP protein Cmr4 [Oscillatoriales cyanobacterium M59_W2019_021]
MYQKAYGIIETLAPLHVGASAGEETGNLNLIFRDQFTLTGIIPGSSIRGRFRADMRLEKGNCDYWYGREAQNAKQGANGSTSQTVPASPEPTPETVTQPGQTATPATNEGTTEGAVKFEYASILWLPVYCPNQPIVRVSCPSLLKRYQKIAGLTPHRIQPYSYYVPQHAEKPKRDRLFFNLGFLPLKTEESKLKEYLPSQIDDAEDHLLLVVKDTEMAMIHDMALYRQSRVALKEDEKIVAGTSFFNVEALPEKTVLVFPIALKKTEEIPNPRSDFAREAKLETSKELYFGGLESVGFGRTQVTLKEAKQVAQDSTQDSTET